MAKEKKSQHEFYSIDIASDYEFTDLENLILNIAGGLPMEHLSEDERRMMGAAIFGYELFSERIRKE